MEHQPVLTEQVIKFIPQKENLRIIDGTYGSGGHAESILQRLSEDSIYIGFDQDSSVQPRKNHAQDSRFHFINDSYHTIQENCGEQKYDVILLDCGISSEQVDTVNRGFSWKHDAPLDMRFNQKKGLPVSELIAQKTEEELQESIKKYGEIYKIGKLVAWIKRELPKTTTELADIIFIFYRNIPRSQRINRVTRIFQALRIEANNELEILQQGIDNAYEVLEKKGRILCITYHSLEHKIVKYTFKKWQKEKRGEMITKKVVKPSHEEIKYNKRAKYAQLRVFEKHD
ncbi:16S rRNA (cytosine(1402)-N(4))-methyltransferase RsmH [Candidatus Margulisiibacteriota bacterium]